MLWRTSVEVDMESRDAFKSLHNLYLVVGRQVDASVAEPVCMAAVGEDHSHFTLVFCDLSIVWTVSVGDAVRCWDELYHAVI